MFKNLLKRSGANTPSPKSTGENTRNDVHAAGVPNLEVFQTHWRQAMGVIRKHASDNGTRSYTSDEVNTVIHYIDKMCDLLVNEHEENGQQGHCLVYLLTEDILEQMVSWCLNSGVYENKIKYELLKILENLISQSEQPLLYHKPVIRPLLSLLGSCMDTTLPQIENHVILLLHQLCVCISRNPQYLELFFNVSYSSGQNNFLIFCLLIPYIHREGALGQQARDALLLIMAASARNQVIGKYIANNSDFCPVLATGLSALYSSLPHKVRPEGHEDWYRIEKEHYLDMPDVQMIINCLEFCNAVVQVAHVLVGQQLIDFIYNGFLLPVMAPALLQSAIEEQVSAIAYLELFVRTITEPSLLRAFLHFILATKHDDVVILEWLIDRISSSTKLCMVSLSLFKTLVELNCEDVMFALCFKYLYRLTHVMQSQRRAIKEVDIYGKIADKLLQLEPECCRSDLTEEQQKLVVSHNDGVSIRSEFDLLSNLPFNFGFGNNRNGLHSIFSSGLMLSSASVDDYKSSYLDYLHQARAMITQCANSCTTWCYTYDGEIPPHNAAIESLNISSRRGARSNSITSVNKYDTPDPSVEDDVPLLGADSPLASSHKPTSSSPCVRQKSDDSVLIDITTDEVPLSQTQQILDQQLIPPIDDVPLCISDSTTPKSLDDDEPLLSLGDVQQNLTLNLLIQGQGLELPSLISPPLPTSTSQSQQSFHLNDQSNSLVQNKISQSEPIICSTPTDHRQFESFLSYLDESVDNVIVDPEKGGDALMEEIDSAIKEAEIKAEKQKEKMEVSEKSAADLLSQFQTGSSMSVSLASLEAHPVENFVDPRPKKKQPTDFQLRLEESTDNTPSIGPFLVTLLSKLENMMNNSLSVNLLLTGLVTRIASYPQPLLRSFLLNHSLVFQPSVKSLIQVLSSVRTKVDSYAKRVDNFNVLLLQARQIMIEKSENLEDESAEVKQRSASMMTHAGERDLDNTRSPGKRLADFLRGSNKPAAKQPLQPELVFENNGYKFSNNKQADRVKFESAEARLATMNTKKAIYCALVLEEFVKELAALSQEHAVQSDEGYQTE